MYFSAVFIFVKPAVDKEAFDKQDEYQQRLLLADYFYTLAEANELNFKVIDKNQIRIEL